jgi:hypothetical protein
VGGRCVRAARDNQGATFERLNLQT